jgi:hypothetical protein
MLVMIAIKLQLDILEYFVMKNISLDSLKKLGMIEKPSELEKQEFQKLRQELNEINNWFQKTAK